MKGRLSPLVKDILANKESRASFRRAIRTGAPFTHDGKRYVIREEPPK